MHKTLIPLLIVLAWALPASAQVRSWETRDGRQWQEVSAPATQPARDPLLDRVADLVSRRDYSPARKLLVPWLKANRAAASRDWGLYLLGEINFQADDRFQSFYNFDELMDSYPSSPWFYRALQRQYDIADDYLKGHRNRFLGIPMFHAIDEAIEMLFRIQQRSPGSPLADKALLRTADYYYDTRQYDLASDAYAAYSRSYPRSPTLPRVKLRQAFSSLAQFRDERFDATPAIDARQQFVDLMAAYPMVAERENASAFLDWIDAALSRKVYRTALFYQRTQKPEAAAYHFRYVVKNFARYPEAAEARKQLQRMNLPVEAAPAPATQPAAASPEP